MVIEYGPPLPFTDLCNGTLEIFHLMVESLMCTRESFVARFFSLFTRCYERRLSSGSGRCSSCWASRVQVTASPSLALQADTATEHDVIARLSHRNDRSHHPPMRRPSVHISAVRVLLEPEN